MLTSQKRNCGFLVCLKEAMAAPTVFASVFADKDLLALLKYCWRVTNYLVNRTAQEAVKSGHIHLDHVKVKADLLICHYKQHLAGGMAGKVQVSYYEWPSFLDPSPVSWGDDLVNTYTFLLFSCLFFTFLFPQKRHREPIRHG